MSQRASGAADFLSLEGRERESERDRRSRPRSPRSSRLSALLDWQAVRVLLRPPVESDRLEFIRAMAASEALHEPWISDIATDEYFDRQLVRVTHDRYDANLVCLVDGGQIAGTFNITEIVRGVFQSAYLSYAAVAGHEGQGLMSEGLQLLLDRAFMELGLHRLEANIQPGNARSIALVRRAGFVCEGTSPRYLKLGGEWRDHQHWVLLAEDWAAQAESAALHS